MKYTRSAGGVVLNNNQQIILVSQKGKSWSLPKGHVEAGEDLLAAAKREIYEEASVKDLEYLGDVGSYGRFQCGDPSSGEYKTISIFVFKTNESVLQPQDPDNPEAKWIGIDDVTNWLSWKEDKEFFVKMVVPFLVKLKFIKK